MDAAELNELMEDYRENLMMQLKKPLASDATIGFLRMIAVENKVAAKSIVHVIESHLMRVDTAIKLPALYLLDSLAQNCPDPYVHHITHHIAKMFEDVWRGASVENRGRLERLLRLWAERAIFAPEVLAACRNVVQPGAAQQQPVAAARPTPGRADPRKRAAPAGAAPGASIPLPGAPGASAHPVYSAYRPASVHPAYPSAATNYASAGRPAAYPVRPQPYGAPLPGAHLHQRPNFPSARGAPGQPAASSSTANFPPIQQAKFERVRLKEFWPQALELLLRASQKTRTFVLDRNLVRYQRRHSEKKGSRQWYAPADMWIAGTVMQAADDDAADGDAQEDAAADAAPQRYTVPKDDTQTTCDISSEPFAEEWDDEAQEWVYVDAVRLPPNDSPLLATLSVEARRQFSGGKIVKVSLLDKDALASINSAGGGDSGKRGPDSRDGALPPGKRVKTEL